MPMWWRRCYFHSRRGAFAMALAWERFLKWSYLKELGIWKQHRQQDTKQMQRLSSYRICSRYFCISSRTSSQSNGVLCMSECMAFLLMLCIVCYMVAMTRFSPCSQCFLSLFPLLLPLWVSGCVCDLIVSFVMAMAMATVGFQFWFPLHSTISILLDSLSDYCLPNKCVCLFCMA